MNQKNQVRNLNISKEKNDRTGIFKVQPWKVLQKIYFSFFEFFKLPK